MGSRQSTTLHAENHLRGSSRSAVSSTVDPHRHASIPATVDVQRLPSLPPPPPPCFDSTADRPPTGVGCAPERSRRRTTVSGILGALRRKSAGGNRRRRTRPNGTGAAGGGVVAAPSSTGVDKNLWAKLIARLSRKISGASTRPRPDSSHSVPGLIRGTSSVLPVNRNPLTTVAYKDVTEAELKEHQHQQLAVDAANNNDHFVKRVGQCWFGI